MSIPITIIVQPIATRIITVGVQGPAGNAGILAFTTTVLMFAVTGTPGQLAYSLDYPDQHWKWSVNQNTWVPAF